MLSRTAKSTAAPSAKRSPRARRCSGRSRSPASRTPPATIASAPATSGARTGSPRKAKAIASAKSGAAPTVTEVREAPTSRIERVKRICESPGASSPARKNFQASAVVVADERGGEGDREGDDERRERRLRIAPSPRGRARARITTVIAPNAAAEASASRTGRHAGLGRAHERGRSDGAAGRLGDAGSPP